MVRYGTLLYDLYQKSKIIEVNPSKWFERFYRDPDKATGSWRGWSPAYAPSAGPSIMALSPRGKKQHKNQLEPTSKNIAYVSMSNTWVQLCIYDVCCQLSVYLQNSYELLSPLIGFALLPRKEIVLGGPYRYTWFRTYEDRGTNLCKEKEDEWKGEENKGRKRKEGERKGKEGERKGKGKETEEERTWGKGLYAIWG